MSDARASAGRGQAPPATPLKARFASADGSELITVVSSESSKVKPTFLQARPPAQTCQGQPRAPVCTTLLLNACMAPDNSTGMRCKSGTSWLRACA